MVTGPSTTKMLLHSNLAPAAISLVIACKIEKVFHVFNFRKTPCAYKKSGVLHITAKSMYTVMLVLPLSG